MAHELLVNDFRGLAEKLEEVAGPVALLMVIPAEPNAEDAWTIVVSTKEFDKRSRRESLEEFASFLNQVLSDLVRPSIKGATVLKSDDPFVKAINSAIRAEHSSVVDIFGTTVAGVEIPRGIVFESKRIAA